VRIDTRDAASWQNLGGREVCALFSGESERVCLQRLAPAEIVFTNSVDSVELLVLAGSVIAGDQTCERGSWIRLPAGEYPEFEAGERGVTLYVKTGRPSNAPTEA